MLLPFLLSVAALAARDVQTTPKHESGCVLEVRAIDALGHLIESGTFRIGSAPEERPTLAAIELPCGKHAFNASALGFRPKAGNVDLKSGHNLHVIQLDVGVEGGTTKFSPLFLIQDFDRMRACDTVVAVSLLDPGERRASKISARGAFRLEGLPMGYYSFLLLGKDAPCGSATTQLKDHRSTEVPLVFRPL